MSENVKFTAAGSATPMGPPLLPGGLTQRIFAHTAERFGGGPFTAIPLPTPQTFLNLGSLRFAPAPLTEMVSFLLGNPLSFALPSFSDESF